jgi:hypothetical protein
MAVTGLRNLCTPSYVYLVISLFALFIMLIQNMYNSDTYCMGNYTCKVSNLYLIFIVKLVYILIWTWVLNLICKAGAPVVSWILVLFPLILMFIFISMFFVFQTANIPVSLT